MFTLNPLGNPDALWQHSVMILVSAILGYIIGHIDTIQIVRGLEMKLARLDSDLTKYSSQPSISGNNVATSADIIHDEPLVTSFSESDKADDLKKIEGVNNDIEAVLNSNGIYTYQQLSQTNSIKLNEMLRQSDIHFQTHEPQTWPQQAQLASHGMWEELKELQNELSKSRS